MRKRQAVTVRAVLTAAMLAATCLQSSGSTAAVPRSSAPRPLTPDELRQILPGATIAEIVPYELRYMISPEKFNEDGTYIEYADNFELEGRYTIEGEKVCVVADGRDKVCRYLLVDPNGRHWISKSLIPTDFRLVSINHYGK